MSKSSQAILAESRRWVERVVLGLNLCPFAHEVVKEDRLRYLLSGATDLEGSLLELADEWRLLDRDPAISTTLLVYPERYASFDEYLGFLALAEELLRMESREGVYQLASFHPEYCFSGTEPEDAGNLTNRSPFPMVHILREDEITRALERFPDPAKIPIRNQAICRKLGLAGLRDILGD